MKILLVGNPNAGKSTLFNLLTGAHEKVGNWHGVTVGAAEREYSANGQKVTVCDLPGIYSMESMSMEEKYTRDYLLANPSAPVLFISEYAGLERSLPLFLSILSGRKAALVLTKRKAFEREGGRLYEGELASRLGVPVIFADRRSGKQLKAQ